MLRRLLPLLGVLVAPFALVVGIWAGGHPDSLPGPVRDLLVNEEARVYEEAVDVITQDFFREVDRDELLDEALQAAVEALDDRFSHYFDPETYRQFQHATAGEFEGVGMTVQEVPRGLEILTVFDDSPAERAGLKKGDRIVAVDGRSLQGMSSEASTALIKGPAGTRVTLTIVSGGERRDQRVERAAVAVPVVESEMVEHRGEPYAHVSLESFTSGAHGEVRQAIRRLLDRGAQGVVLDLRDNGGGLLDEAVLVASIFVGDGPIVRTNGRARPSRTYEASGQAIDEDIPVVVLVNKGSASASEIVTGALQDRDRATVVGRRTFGKGVFQEVEELSNGGALDITVGEYFTPDGRNLAPRNGDPGGIAPDIRALDRPATEDVDEALQAALDALARRA